MKLVKFSVTNFRSILKAQDIPISNITVLVGKNNEGKSNLLKALSIAMEIIKYHARYHAGRYVRRSASDKEGHIAGYRGRYGMPSSMRTRQIISKYPLRLFSDDIYRWDQDFPISKKKYKGKKQTILKLEFQLSDEEIKIFRKIAGKKVNNTLPLNITINPENRYTLELAKGGEDLKLKIDAISGYINESISFNYIPAVRTHEKISEVIDDLLSHQLYSLERKPEYQKALKIIDDLEKPILKEISQSIKEPLSEFLPNIKKVIISTTGRTTGMKQRRKFDVEIDDGTPTSIKQKGDGVQSLAALGLLKNKSRRTGVSIIAIEEPEAHLHSGAIHRLQKMIESLKPDNKDNRQDNQIVLATHNPLFVNRYSTKSNIIVDKGKAEPAKNIKTIRDTLGVQVSDNLTNARFVLVVEGICDKRSLEAILRAVSPKIKTALNNNELSIYPIGGATKLQQHLSVLEMHGCLYHVFFDHDRDAKNKIKNAIKDGSLSASDYTHSVCDGMKQAEFEDCIDPNIYRSEVRKKFKVDLDFTGISEEDSKWSDRAEKCFLKTGRELDNKTKQDIKNIIVSCIEKNPSNALCKNKGKIIKEQLVKELEDLLDTE